MSRQKVLLTLFAAAAVGACDEPLPSEVEGDLDAYGPLALVVPRIEAGGLPASDRVDSGTAPVAGPQLGSFDLRDIEFYASIIDPHTTVNFGDGYAEAVGRHNYTGNVGRVRTTANVAFEDRHLGSQEAERQDNVEFLLDFGRTKFIWVGARVNAEQKCGLSLDGSSRHYASWEAYQGVGVSRWGEVSASTSSGLVKLEPCARRTESEPADGGSSGGERYYYCTYLITYDLDTGEIYRATLLFCNAGSVDDRL